MIENEPLGPTGG